MAVDPNTPTSGSIYVPGPAQEHFGHPSTWPTGQPQPPTWPPPQPPKARPSKVPLIAALAVVTVLVGSGVAVGVMAIAGRDRRAATAGPSPTPSWSSVFGNQNTGPAAAPTTKGPVLTPLGETLVFTRTGGDIDDEVEYTLTADKTYTRAPESSYYKPEKGVFYAVNALIVVRRGSTYGCACDFALIAKDGTVYEAAPAVGFPNRLEAAKINAGQKLSGLVVFDVPKTAYVGARIELRADFFGAGDEGYWTLP